MADGAVGRSSGFKPGASSMIDRISCRSTVHNRLPKLIIPPLPVTSWKRLQGAPDVSDKDKYIITIIITQTET